MANEDTLILRIQEIGARQAASNIKDLRAAFRGAGSDTQAFTRQQAAGTKTASDYNREIQRGVSLLGDYRRAKAQAANAPDAIGGSGARRGLSQAGQIASGLGATGVGQGLGLATDAIGFAEALPNLKAGLVGMGPLGLAAGAAGLAAAGGLALLNAALEPGQRAAANYVEGIKQLNTILVTGTREQLEAARDNVSVQIQVAEITRNALQEQFFQTADEIRAGAGALGDQAVGAAILLNAEGINTLKAEAEGAQADIDRLNLQLGLFDDALAENATAANDAAAAELALAEARQANTDRQIQNEIRILSNIPASTEALDARLDAINREQAILREYLDAGNLSVAMTEQLNRQFAELSAEESLLAIKIAPVVAETQALAEAAEIAADKEKSLADAIIQAGRDASKTRDEIRKLEADIANAEQQSVAKIAAIATTLTDALAKAAAEKTDALSEADIEAASARLEAQAEANKEAEKLEEEHEKNLLKIARDFNRSSTQAVQDRNAVAFDAAQTARDDALDDERDSYKTRKKEISQRLKDTEKEIDARLREQQRLIAKRYDEQLRTAHEAANKARLQEIARFNAEAAEKQRQYSALQAQLQAYNAAASGTAKAGANNLLATHQAYWQEALNIANSAVGALGAAAAGSKGIVPKLDTGGVITRTGMALVHKNEVVLNQRQQRDMMGGFTFAPVIKGANTRQIKREVNRELDKMLHDMETD